MTGPPTDAASPKHLPPGLTATVRVVEEILGRVIADAEGRGLYEHVEAVRRDMVALREADDEGAREAALDRADRRIEALSIEEKTAFARAYTLYLQLVNVCENAYRTHRLRGARGDVADDGPEATPAGRAPGARLTFVLTAHPTESRSPGNIRLLRRVQHHVVEALGRRSPIDAREIENLLHLAWRVGTHPARKPTVEDEADHLFSLFTDPILDEVIALAEAGHQVLFRSWVGGDKDGHPGVGPDQTRSALGRSRARLLSFVRGALLGPVREDVALADAEAARSVGLDRAGGAHGRDGTPSLEEPPSPLARALAGLESALVALDGVGDGDGRRVARLGAAVDAFQSAYRDRFGVAHPALVRLSTLTDVFPALVVPLELREERGRFGADQPIADMMRCVARIAEGGRVGAYARAVVVSMTLEAVDLLEAQALAEGVVGSGQVPVIPLFELPDVLERAHGILEEAWAHARFRDAVRARGHLEVMLGYSDTAKRMGMLASRVAIHDAMARICRWAEAEGVTPLFFHGHGGSVGRGGGRIEDLAATWPPQARTPYKYTVQGEMAERTLASPEILRSLVEKVARVQADPPAYRPVGVLTRDLASASAAAFATHVASAPFLDLLARATPYARLQSLTIGSRPSRRGEGGLEKLRAIPWVLCWTQTRFLVHAWLGAGHAWRDRADTPGLEAALAEARRTDPLFRSWSRLLSFTLAKTEPSLWRRYHARLAADATPGLVEELDADCRAAHDLARRAVAADTLLPDRPWLEESIRYRAPMIHPLNLIQIGLLARVEWTDAEVRLFRETVTGIAAGMLTTG